MARETPVDLPTRRRIARAALIVLAPICLRVVLALLVDDFEDDAWARDLIAQQLSGEMRAGSLSMASILSVSVWLPAWQLLCAACERVVHEPYYVPKLLSALFGGLSPAIVFALARHLATGAGEGEGGSMRAAWTAWAFAALAPWHAMYSATGMSESFYGFWILVAMYGLVRSRADNRWLLVAALALGPATWTRFEGWVLAGAIPAIALVQRRARPVTFVAACVLIAVPPVLWLAINRAVSGDALHFARVGANDVRNFLAFRGTAFSDRGPLAIARHVAYIAAANGVVVTLLAARGLLRRRTSDTRALGAAILALLGLLLTLWLARRQVGWRRYYVPLGMPLCAAAGLGLVDLRRPRVAILAVALEALIVVGVQTHFMVTWVRPRIAARRDAATFLRARSGTIYCDEPAVRMLSGLPPERFVNQWQLPRGRDHDPDAMLASMRASRVRWVVFADLDYSALPHTFPWMRASRVEPPFALALASRPERRRLQAVSVNVYEILP